ncbi:MAG TPA: hypothetical protein VGH19_16585 [Verrucomicrobiae bacterium]
MEPKGQRLRQEHKQQSETSLNSASNTDTRLFNSVEEVLREDAAQNPPPDSLSHRVASSSSKDAASLPKPWWQKLIGGN